MQLPQRFSGTVVHGVGRGHKTLGFPTANLDPDAWNVDTTDNDFGVYGGIIFVPGFPPRIGVVSVGKNLTFQVSTPTFEVHILDFDADIYGVDITVELRVRIRSMVSFTSIEQLKAQITSDVDSARSSLKEAYEEAFNKAQDPP
jgi:FAD synthase